MWKCPGMLNPAPKHAQMLNMPCKNFWSYRQDWSWVMPLSGENPRGAKQSGSRYPAIVCLAKGASLMPLPLMRMHCTSWINWTVSRSRYLKRPSKQVCLHCHTPDYVNGFYQQYDNLVILYNEKFAKSGQKIVAALRDNGLLTPAQFDAAGHADAAMIYYHLALRYTRIFPDLFEFVDIGGILSGQRIDGNPTTRYHVGLVGDGGAWGEQFIAFMQGDVAQQLYEDHGLLRLC